jgi:NADPH-dependent 2,4-dienoyl-CoA reductase/sulfur reductase-like enzyme
MVPPGCPDVGIHSIERLRGRVTLAAVRIPTAIIGNGGAAAEAVLALRARGYTGEIHLFADNDHAPYNPMLGPYLVAGKIPLDRAFPFGGEQAFYGANKVTAHLGEPVVSLDAEARRLITASGSEYEYERCLVATGARPSVPPISGLREALAGADGMPRAGTAEGAPGAEMADKAPAGGYAVPARRVFTLQTLDDALALKRAVDELLACHREPASGPVELRGAMADRPCAAVVGASFAGVKIAAVLHGLGLKVILIEREASILPLAAHSEAARIMEAHLLDLGYGLRLGAALRAVAVRDAAAPDGSGTGAPTTAGHAMPDAAGAAPPGGGKTPPAGGALAAGVSAALPAGAKGKIRLDFGALPGAADPGGAGGTACEEGAAHEDVDLLVVCTGNRPALGFLAPGQVDLGAGIMVDETMSSNVPGLYAAGDVAQGKNLASGRHEIIGSWSSARYQGRAAGFSLAGEASGYLGGIPHNITHVGRMLFASVGCVDDYEKVSISREGDSWEMKLWREGRLVGVNLLDRCLSAGVVKQAFLKAAMGAAGETEATWTSFSG